MKVHLLVLALLLAGCPLAQAQDAAAPSGETRRQIDKALGLAIAADQLCGTAYLKIVIANGEQVGLSLDDMLRRDKPEVDEQARRVLAQNDSDDLKDKFCQKVRRAADSPAAR